MAFYPDPQYNVAVFVPLAFAASFGTATASSATGCNGTAVASLPPFPKKVTVTAVKLRCTTIPDTGSTGVRAVFLNGTSTFATVTLTTATASQWLTGTVTAANAVLTADTSPTVNVVGTATASADANGSYDIWFEYEATY